MNALTGLKRAKSDPRIISSGPSSLPTTDRVARNLGWFSIALGVTQILMPRRYTRLLGMRGSEGLVQAFGVREITSGMLSLSVDKKVGLWSRVAGDALDLAVLARLYHPANRKRDNVGVALCMVAGIAAIDFLTAASAQVVHGRSGETRDYSDRSGFPGGLASARRLAASR